MNKLEQLLERVICLKIEDHYCLVHLSRGQSPRLLRLSASHLTTKAIRRTLLRVHRLHFVHPHPVLCAHRRNPVDHELWLKSGASLLHVPVGRKWAAPLKQQFPHWWKD